MSRFIDFVLHIFNRSRFTGAVDTPDSRDYIDKPLKGIRLPKEVDLWRKAELIHLQETSNPLVFKKQSRNSCTAFSISYCKILTNLCKGGEVIKHDPEFQWKKQEEEFGANRSWGCTLQGALKAVLKWSQSYPIKEYRKIDKNDLRQIKCRLATGSPVYTAISWKRTPDGKSNTYSTSLFSGIWEWFSTKVLGGHSITVFGFNDKLNCLLAYDPMHKQWGKNSRKGELHIPYTEVPHMASMYVLYDLIDKK